MIFVTVGTHEQQFDRLVEYMDVWAKNHDEKVMIQIGFCNYIPRWAKWERILTYSSMIKHIKDARIIITHGGPSSFIMSLQEKKIPIVVPRMKEFGEHINNHQLDFTREMVRKYNNILVVEKIESLANILDEYDFLVRQMNIGVVRHAEQFLMGFVQVVDELLR